ncbi:MAG: DUF92 domain-containing protein [Candidatus Diapherotrites archaeon]|nr:DUF92 domain-containing protein [Candidatus Diapherotrites archaeon]
MIDSSFIVAITQIIISLITYYKKLMSLRGILLANMFGLIVFYFGGLSAFFTMIIFFVLAEISTYIGRLENKEKHERRDIFNIIGNGLPAVMAIAFGYKPAFFGAMAAALSDTMSSELGMMTKISPRLITNPKKIVKIGTDGGITLEGTLCGLIGAIIIASTYFFLIEKNIIAFVIITVAGVFGSIIDSILGAELENRKLIDNNSVNFLAVLSAAVFAQTMFNHFI